MTGAASLLSLPRCPDCGEPFAPGDEWLVCRGAAGHRFPVADGVPVFLGGAALEEDAQYGRQLEYFDAQFSRYRDYHLDRWRESYLKRLRDAQALGGPGAPLIGGSGICAATAPDRWRDAGSGLVADEVQGTGHAIKALQIALADRLHSRRADRFWWWCEKRDLARAHRRRGSMQLGMTFHRA